MGARFKQYTPNWEGPLTPEQSIRAFTSVFEKASVTNGDGGSFVSHFGNKKWL